MLFDYSSNHVVNEVSICWSENSVFLGNIAIFQHQLLLLKRRPNSRLIFPDSWMSFFYKKLEFVDWALFPVDMKLTNLKKVGEIFVFWWFCKTLDLPLEDLLTTQSKFVEKKNEFTNLGLGLIFQNKRSSYRCFRRLWKDSIFRYINPPK